MLQNNFKKGDVAVAEVELTQDTLIVHVQGTDQLWAPKSRLEISLSHVVGAEADR